MKRFMFLHFGFEQPTPKVMKSWEKWFKSIARKQVDQAGFAGGMEISKAGVKSLPWDENCITGYNVIEARSLKEAEKLAKSNPFVSSIRVYEIR